MNDQFLEHYKSVLEDKRLQKKDSTKRAIVIIALVMVSMVAFMGLVQVLLHAQKDSEEYALCYDYFVSSIAFQKLNAPESKIRMNSYSSSTQYSPEDDSPTRTVEIGFLVNFRSFTVTCHKENDVWQVCRECTRFD